MGATGDILHCVNAAESLQSASERFRPDLNSLTLELDSHADMPVLGRNSYVFVHTGRSVLHNAILFWVVLLMMSQPAGGS
jgi:hypothetical protein